MSATRKLREWAWNADFRLVNGRWRRNWLAHVVHKSFMLVAKQLDRKPDRCWMRLAMWAMGWEGYGIERKTVTPGCNWCGKCRKSE